MTDRELLEYAAKAAGIEIDLVAFSDGSFICYHKGNAFSWDASNEWNPLIDDGEALRLAVKLRIHIRHFPHDVEAQFERGFWREDDGNDPLAATRRAITRAAAEIGRMME